MAAFSRSGAITQVGPADLGKGAFSSSWQALRARGCLHPLNAGSVGCCRSPGGRGNQRAWPERNGLNACPVNDLNGDGVVNVLDVEIVINAALGLGCAAQ